jgi:hypothetical protein
MSELFLEYNIQMSYVQIRSLCFKFGDTDNEKDKLESKKTNKSDKVVETDEKESILPNVDDIDTKKVCLDVETIEKEENIDESDDFE